MRRGARGSLSPPMEEGAEAMVPTGALRFVDELASSAPRRVRAPRSTTGRAPARPARCTATGSTGWSSDLLADPGSADITAGVDLGAVAARASALGFEVRSGRCDSHRPWPRSGSRSGLRAERARQGELLNAGRGTDAARAWEGRNRARLLVDPSGLGRLRWLLLATAGLGEPGWSARARALEPAFD